MLSIKHRDERNSNSSCKEVRKNSATLQSSSRKNRVKGNLILNLPLMAVSKGL